MNLSPKEMAALEAFRKRESFEGIAELLEPLPLRYPGHPALELSQWLLTQAYLKMGPSGKEKAGELIGQLSRNFPKSRYRRNSLLSFAKTSPRDEKRELYKLILKDDPTDMKTLYLLAEIEWFHHKDRIAATESLRRFQSLHPERSQDPEIQKFAFQAAPFLENALQVKAPEPPKAAPRNPEADAAWHLKVENYLLAAPEFEKGGMPGLAFCSYERENQRRERDGQGEWAETGTIYLKAAKKLEELGMQSLAAGRYRAIISRYKAGSPEVAGAAQKALDELSPKPPEAGRTSQNVFFNPELEKLQSEFSRRYGLAPSSPTIAAKDIPRQRRPGLYKTPEDELKAEFEIGRQADNLLSAEKFDQLDRLANEFRTIKARTQRGIWKLRLFYIGLGGNTTDETSRLARIRLLEKWILANPRSVTARTALASAWSGLAWQARGHETVDKIPAGALFQYRQRIATARKQLDFALRLPDRCPQTYAVNLSITHQEGRPQEEIASSLKSALSIEPLYLPIYTAHAHFLQSKWGGNEGDWENFAEKSATAFNPAEGMELYTRILWTMAFELNPNGRYFFGRTTASWPKMRQGFIEMLKKYPDSWINLNTFAWFACSSGDKPTAKALFSMIGEQFDRGLWGSDEAYAAWRTWAN